MQLATLLEVGSVDEPIETFLAGAGRIVRRLGDRHDSRSRICDLRLDDARVVVKYADADPEAVGWLENALPFHAAVRHPVIAALHGHLRTDAGGIALVLEWVPGEVLVDGFDPAVADRDAPGSPYRRFLVLPAAVLVGHVAAVIDAHVAVADAGFVAVDFHDGCVVHDEDGGRVSLIDLDHYRPGPYVLDADRQLGSTSLMAPEELERHATIDERTMVHTLGRFALITLGCARSSPPERAAWRADDARFEVACVAADPEPSRRFATVRDLAAAWTADAGKRAEPAS